MVSTNIAHYAVTALMTATALTLTSCGTAASSGDKPAAQSAPPPLGSAIHVSGKGDWNSDGYEGTVTAESKEVICTKTDGTRFLVLHVDVAATKGAVPTSSWQVQTANAIPIPNESFTTSEIAGPPLGSSVTSKARGDIAFTIPPKTTPTTLELLGAHPIDAAIARWSIGDLPSAFTCPASVQTTTPSGPGN